MAICKPAFGIASVSGPVGDVRFAKCPGYQVVRSRGRRKKRTSTRFFRALSYFRNARRAWHSLAPGYQAAWQTWARSWVAPSNRFADDYLIAKHAFIRQHVLNAYSSASGPSMPPPFKGSPAIAAFTFLYNTAPALSSFIHYDSIYRSTLYGVFAATRSVTLKRDYCPPPKIFYDSSILNDYWESHMTAAFNAAIGYPRAGEAIILTFRLKKEDWYYSPLYTYKLTATAPP